MSSNYFFGILSFYPLGDCRMILPISFLCQLPQPPRSWDVCFFHCGLASRNSFHPTGVSLFKYSLRVGPRPFEFWNSSVRRVIGMVLSLGTLSTLLGFLFSNTLCAWDLIRLNSRIDWYDAS